ncbi:hypothetical protein NDA14_005368 [Ustilago hordei]|nr:hypothetical protein NDA14_005368 [Ustilago hordei]
MKGCVCCPGLGKGVHVQDLVQEPLDIWSIRQRESQLDADAIDQDARGSIWFGTGLAGGKEGVGTGAAKVGGVSGGEDACHGPGCSRSRRVTGSYGRSTGIEDLVEISREHGRSAVSMETMDSYGLTCKGGPSTATRRTKLKEQAQP